MDLNRETLSEWPIGVQDGTIVDVDDKELDLELDRLKRSLGLDPSGRTVGRFRIISQLGKGGMGVVYAAEDPELDRKVALKLVRARQRGSRVRLQARLQREARALARLTHPNVVCVYDVGSDGDELFVAMELVDGPTLLEWQSERERSLDELLHVYLQAAAGLAAAHDAQLVHRDFKPENVFVTSNGRVLVGDFGLANLEDAVATTADDDSGASTSGLTEAGTLLGTLGYMAPEQLRGELVDARADQFAFCVALWEAIAGERPFAGSHGEALLAAIDAGEMRLAERVPRRLRTVLRRGLSYHRDARFAELRELAAAIESAGDRRSYLGIGIGMTAIAAVVAAALWLRETPASCDERERIDRVWAEGREALAERLEEGSAEVLEHRAEAAVVHLRTRADFVCRAPSENRQRVLQRAVDEFAAALASPKALNIEGWTALIASLETLDLDRPAIDPEVAAAIDRSRLHEWSGESELAWSTADQAVALASEDGGWSASMSEALVQRGRMFFSRLEHAQALRDFVAAQAHAEGSGYAAQLLRARLEEAKVLIRSEGDANRGALALVRLEPLLHRQSRPLSPDRALAHELRRDLASLRGEAAVSIAHAFAATFIHVVVHPDPVATARGYLHFGVVLTRFGFAGAESLHEKSASMLHDVTPSTNPLQANIDYNQALLDIEAEDPSIRTKGRATLERLHRHEDLRFRIVAARALLYMALRDGDVVAIRALLDELRADPQNADDLHLLMGGARLGALDLASLDRARARYLEQDNVLFLTDLEYDLAGALARASCDLAAVGRARLEQVEPSAAVEQSRSDFERLLASLDCE